MESNWQIHNSSGEHRVIVTRNLPGKKWIEILEDAGCRIEAWVGRKGLTGRQIVNAIGDNCRAAIGMLSENWSAELFAALQKAGGKVYSNYAVGFNNVDLEAATKNGIAVGNTPGVLTGATAELAVALTLAAARRLGEGERFLRAGLFQGWAPSLLLGRLLERKTIGIIGAGRIGSAYAKIMLQGFRTNIIYHGKRVNHSLENFVSAFNDFLAKQGERPVFCRKADNLEDLLIQSDCVSLHTVLNRETHHLIDARRLSLMKKNGILINTSRGQVVDEKALVEHCLNNPQFRAGLDVFEEEPRLAPGLARLENVFILPHLGSATNWTRRSMAVLASMNLGAIIKGRPAWTKPEMELFLSPDPPEAAPSILNAKELGLVLI